MRVDLQDIAEFHARSAALVDALNLLFCEGSVPEREVVDCAGEFGGVGKIRRPLPDAERVAGRKGEVCERGGLLAQGAIGGTLALIYPEGAIVADLRPELYCSGRAYCPFGNRELRARRMGWQVEGAAVLPFVEFALMEDAVWPDGRRGDGRLVVEGAVEDESVVIAACGDFARGDRKGAEVRARDGEIAEERLDCEAPVGDGHREPVAIHELDL